MDDKNNPALTLDDILHQLTKPSVIQGSGQNLEKQNPVAPPALPKPPQPPASGEVRLPTLGGESKTSPPSLGSSPTTAVPQRSNISLTIRTMAQDIERLKRGQSLAPLEVKRVIQPPQQQSSTATPVPKEEPTVEAPKMTSMGAVLPRPTLPPRPAIRPMPTIPSMPVPKQSPPTPLKETPKKQPTEEYVPEHYHREEVVGKPDDMLPEYLGAQVPKKIVKSVEERLQYGLIAKIIGSGMTAGIIITVVIAVVAYFLLSFFVFNVEEPILSPSPNPTTQITQAPNLNELESIFRNIVSVSFPLPLNQSETATNLKSFIKGTEINQNEFKKINFVSSDSQVTVLTFTDLMDRLSVQYPAELRDTIKESNMAFMYGQEELLGTAESLPDPGLANKKVVLIVEIKDAPKAKEILRTWESTMSEDLRNLFNIDPGKAATLGFNDNAYRGVPIRYRNFPLPDRSIDYAIVYSLAGNQYLVITNSRESAYSPIEKITGL